MEWLYGKPLESRCLDPTNHTLRTGSVRCSSVLVVLSDSLPKVDGLIDQTAAVAVYIRCAKNQLLTSIAYCRVDEKNAVRVQHCWWFELICLITVRFWQRQAAMWSDCIQIPLWASRCPVGAAWLSLAEHLGPG